MSVSFGADTPWPLRHVWIVVALPIASCAVQPPYQTPALPVETHWSNTSEQPVSTAQTVATPARSDWWPLLHDPAIDALVTAALSDNPTLAQAAAAIDEARATARINRSALWPAVDLQGSATHARVPNTFSFGTPFTVLENSAAGGPSLSWELDLWGRIRQSAAAASSRLAARTADAEQARISLTAQIASGVLSLRACEYSLTVRNRDIAARQTELELTRRRRLVGNVAPAEEATANTNLANARTDQISQQEQCTRNVDSLVALTGRDASEVGSLVAQSRDHGPVPADTNAAPPPVVDVDPDALMPVPPPLSLALPATVLLGHPRVISAERELAARWSDIAVTRADRLPTIDLAAALSGNWLQAFNTSAGFTTWTLGATLSAPLFDDGAHAARVRAAQARYAEALASLRDTLRSAAQEVEDALAAQRSAEQRLETSHQAVQSGRVSLLASEARWRAGAISLFELEEARRQFNDAQESEIAAARDRAQAWVELIRASANSIAGEAPMAAVPESQSLERGA